MLIIIDLICTRLLLQPAVFHSEEDNALRQLYGKEEFEILERETKVRRKILISSLQDIKETFPDYPIRIFSLTDLTN